MFIFLHSPFLVRQHPREEQNEHVHTPSALPSHKYHSPYRTQKAYLCGKHICSPDKKKNARKAHLIQD